jgi:hypothetical protein
MNEKSNDTNESKTSSNVVTSCSSHCYQPTAWGACPQYNERDFGPRLSSHVNATWTWPEHWSHDNYQRGHLPQLCIQASGWKAKVLSVLLFWAIDKGR